MTEKIMIPDFIQAHKVGSDAFNWLMQLEGKAFRDVKGRKTQQVNIGGKSYFVKQHFGVGWKEVFKNYTSFKKPVVSALTEVAAIEKVTEIGIPTTPLVAYGERGRNIATMQSFVLTEDLGDIVSLEELCANWQEKPPAPEFKKLLMIKLAQLSAKLHGAGLCHRDYYLCHLVVQKKAFDEGRLELILIDLHRMLQNQTHESSAVMKDIAGLVFSAKDCGFNDDDWMLFKQHYLPLGEQFWVAVENRAEKIYQKFHSAKFQQRLLAEKSALKD
jgi:UDP-glucose:(heptosyl)LPS alpha-1,3-glucosyltransferase/heptose I phosphotransferase